MITGREKEHVSAYKDQNQRAATSDAALDHEQLCKNSPSDDQKKEIAEAFKVASNFLRNKPKTETEIRNRLEKNSFSPEAIDSVVAQLNELNWVNDQKFAQLWIESRNSFRPRSKRMLVYELRRRGVSDRNISESLDQFEESEAAKSCAMRYGRKHLELEKIQFQQKTLNYLRTYGFPSEIARDAAAYAWEALHDHN
ncbi:MAG: RecX family transcriptional regulator [Chloroflexi bacterium]|jgi:regulatory protein|nr:RecX family transcriptional regulator [Chloroflexota bacterium]